MNNNLLSGPALQLTTISILTNLMLASILGIAIALVYKKTHRGVSYSQSFVSSLVLTTIISTIIIMVIGSSLARAFGLIGAFTIVRFRSAIKDIRDMTFLFLSLALGVAAGTDSYQLAILGFIFTSGLVFLLDKIHFGVISNYEYVLTFTLKPHPNEHEPYQKIFEQYLKENMLLNVRSIDEGKGLELSFNIRLKNVKNTHEFTKTLAKIKDVSRVELLNTASDVEY